MKSLLFCGLAMLFLPILIEGCESNPSDLMGGDDNDDKGVESCPVLVTDLTFPFGSQGESFALGRILTSGNSVYWYDYDPGEGDTGGAIKTVSVNGGDVTLLVGELGGVNGFEMDDTHLYWIEYDIGGGTGYVKKVELSTGEITVLAEGTPEQEGGGTSSYDIFFPSGMTLNGDDVCWGEEVGGGAVRCVPKSGGAVRDFARGELFKPMSLVSDESYFYVLDANADGQILRISQTEGALDILTAGFASTQGLASLILDEGVLYWVELIENGPVFSLPAEGGSLSTLDEGLAYPRVIVAGDTDIYYSAANGIYRKSKSGGARMTAATCSNLTSGMLFALDSGSIYITDTGNSQTGQGKIVKALR